MMYNDLNVRFHAIDHRLSTTAGSIVNLTLTGTIHHLVRVSNEMEMRTIYNKYNTKGSAARSALLTIRYPGFGAFLTVLLQCTMRYDPPIITPPLTS
jgi:hypothetical protein